MQKGLIILLLLLGFTATAQECPNLIGPTDGATNVPVDTSIAWEEVIGVTGYIINVGTSPGGGEIVNDQPVGSDTVFTPPLGLPESTEIFVTITLFFFDQPDIVCESQSFTTRNETNPPTCTQLTSPLDGAIDVNVGTTITWNYAPRAIGYRLTIETAPGLGDIENNLDVGNVLSFTPAADFPEATEIFVRVVPYNENGNATGCSRESFTTGALGEPPGCTMLITPPDGAVNVALSPLLEWEPVPGATGYIVNIGRSPFINDILNEGIFFDTSTFVLNFEANNTYFVRIIPFNDAGRAEGCGQESFSTILGCGPYFDEDTGELVDLFPDLLFPDQVGICENQLPTRVTTPDSATGFRWYQVTPTGEEILISEDPFADISSVGLYRYEAYVLINQDGIEIECSSTKEFTVLSSQIATIDFLRIQENNRLFTVEAQVSGIGDYEYALNPDGPFQDSAIFTSLEEGTYTMYVRDKNGCGIVERPFRLAFPPTGFPPYFSPNGDGINDFWQYVPPLENPLRLTKIHIYDRYGKVLAVIGPKSRGWNGFYKGNALPSAGYWYRAQDLDGAVYSGYFSLKR